ncbi:MAG: TolC family protein [Gemmatimonadota bacterium]
MIGVLLGCLLSADLCLGQEGEKRVLSLAEAEEIALRNNPSIEAANRDLALSRAKRSQASHARFLPRLNLTNVWGPIPRQRGVFTETGVLTSPDTTTGLSDLRYFTEIDLELTQPLWTFGKIGGLIDAAGFRVDAAEASVAKERNDVRLKVRKAYWGLVLGYELLQVVEDVLDEAREARTKLEERFDEGSEQVTQNDLFKFDIFTYEINKRHREALDKVELAKAALRAAVGLDDETDLDVETHVLEPLDVTLDSLKTYTDMALSNRPEISRLEAGIGALSSLVEVEKSDFLPQLFVGAQVKYNRAPSRFDPRNPFWSNRTNFFRPGLVVGFNWNLNFVQTRDEVRVAQLELARMSGRQRPLQSGIRLNVKKAYLETRQARANMEESRTALQASENWLRAELQTFDLGIGEVKDVIDAFRANSSMRAEHLRNIFEYNTSLVELSKAVGRDLYAN